MHWKLAVGRGIQLMKDGWLSSKLSMHVTVMVEKVGEDPVMSAK